METVAQKTLPTVEEVLDAYKQTGLIPSAWITIDPAITYGCAAGALAVHLGCEDPFNDAWDRIYMTYSVLNEETGGSFGLSFDDGFQDRPYRYTYYPDDTELGAVTRRGYEIGQAVREWWNAEKGDTPDCGCHSDEELSAGFAIKEG